MKTQKWTFLDKAKAPSGPWKEEPDKVQWTDEATGLPCLAVRHPRSFHWCGYVGVSNGHPFFEKDYSTRLEDCGEEYCYDHTPQGRLSVHGGITFTDHCMEDNKEQTVCHIVESGEDGNVWWFGFDCAHAGDFSPGYDDLAHLNYRPADQYRTLDYVKSECKDLAAQLAAME